MQGSNRSGLQCLEHPNEQITNYCLHFDCLKPLCPDCVELHTKYHQKQEIQSWKHCVNKSARNVKTTLDTLRSVFDKNNQYQSVKSVDFIQSENIKRLNQIKQKIMRIVDDAFNIHQQKLRNIIRSQYRVDPPDLTKLKTAIDELQKILMKLGHASTVLPALKKSLLLDHESLKNYFGGMDYRSKRTQLTQWFVMQNQDPNRLRGYVEDIVRIHTASADQPRQTTTNNFQQDLYGTPLHNYRSPGPQRLASDRRSSGFLQITQKNFFDSECQHKNLHFFMPSSFQLKLLNIDSAHQGVSWRSITFGAKQKLPCFFKSIITPNGQIYLTGGSEQDKRYRQIYRYNYEKNYLQFVCKMNSDRSSHSICYLNNCIYLIGGFSKKSGQVSQQCQVFKISTQSCENIAPLNAPSANSCAVAFGDSHILKFGGVLNKIDGNNLVQIYNVKTNKWTVANIEYPRNQSKMEFLSFSAAVQINNRQILVFGGYDNSEFEKPERTCFVLDVNISTNTVFVKNSNQFPLNYPEGFWNNNPIIHNKKVYALQNITDRENQLTAVADERRVVVFNGEKWL